MCLYQTCNIDNLMKTMDAITRIGCAEDISKLTYNRIIRI